MNNRPVLAATVVLHNVHVQYLVAVDEEGEDEVDENKWQDERGQGAACDAKQTKQENSRNFCVVRERKGVRGGGFAVVFENVSTDHVGEKRDDLNQLAC